ncbi:MAG: sodium:proton antiporter NhaD [Bacteroidia bacterium]|nr:sodium:proton antiporter NhaD [Bacteroidia bacterium]
MTTALILIVFIVGYACIMFEHNIKIDKAGSALVTGTLCWAIYALSGIGEHNVEEQLMHHMSDIASILFFLLGAMTIVELIATHDGFTIITNRIKTTSKVRLLWLISLLTFFLSAILDNLTTAIVMTAMTGRILEEKKDRLWFAGMIVIAANAGGAWSPLGDVTTTMLWIGNQITALNIMKQLIFPSLAVSLVPLIIVSFKFRGAQVTQTSESNGSSVSANERNTIFFSGLGLLLFVPVFKTVTHLPPFMGMMLALGVLWFVTSLVHFQKDYDERKKFSIARAVARIDTPSILFFLGILLAVTALQSYGLLNQLAEFLTNTLPNDYAIGIALGLLSSIVDNVPLVAAAQGMYSLAQFPTDHHFWEFLALTTGTGGSAIIIGSAAGVAVMGIEKIDFMWYMKKISLLALAGFVAGVLVFLLQANLGGY